MKAILGYDHKTFYSGYSGEVDMNYTAVWALIFFLQKGVHVNKEFVAYRQVLPTYMKEMAAGKTWDEE